MQYDLNNWVSISMDAYDSWMMDLQIELNDYEDCGDEEGAYQVECEIRLLASRYADQLRKESNSG